jgi:hemoglobin-like flavoprotein
MTLLPPDLAQTIRASCKPLLEHREVFLGEFHASLMELLPEVPVMREQTGERISQSLLDCVLWVAFTEEPADDVQATLEGISLDAHRLGFPPVGYQAVGHALLRSLHGLYSVEWSASLSSSWIGYHSLLCENWLRGAQIGAVEDLARGPEPAPLASDGRRNGAGPAAEPDEDDDDEDGLSYNEIMMSMTLGSGRTLRRREDHRHLEEDERRS